MKNLLINTLLSAVVCLVVIAVFAPSTGRTRVLDAADSSDTHKGTGIDGETLATARVTDTIAVGHKAKQVIILFFVTAGTTTDVTIDCEDSADGTNWGAMSHITNAAAAAGAQQVITYVVTAVTDHSFKIEHPAPYLRCTFEDLADGNGTIIVHAAITE